MEVLRLEESIDELDQEFMELLRSNDLDQLIKNKLLSVEPIEKAIELASLGFADESVITQNKSKDNYRLFLHRILYRINRLKLFWYDNLKNYDNENSHYLATLRYKIENLWQEWELRQLPIRQFRDLNVKNILYKWVREDLNPPLSNEGSYFQDQMTKEGYKRLLAIASLDGLVEASQLSRVLGGVANDIQATLTRMFLEEYGGGNLTRKHSSFFIEMLKEFNMKITPEAYFDSVPWEVLANINNSFVLCDRKRFFLRYIGGLLYNEVSVPAAFEHYKKAAERLKLSKKSRGYWDIHIKEDKRHGEWMLHDISIPLIESYADLSWELLLGYAHQKFLSKRASKAIVKSIMESEKGELESPI